MEKEQIFYVNLYPVSLLLCLPVLVVCWWNFYVFLCIESNNLQTGINWHHLSYLFTFYFLVLSNCSGWYSNNSIGKGGWHMYHLMFLISKEMRSSLPIQCEVGYVFLIHTIYYLRCNDPRYNLFWALVRKTCWVFHRLFLCLLRCSCAFNFIAFICHISFIVCVY
jgi:hypothetical protein